MAVGFSTGTTLLIQVRFSFPSYCSALILYRVSTTSSHSSEKPPVSGMSTRSVDDRLSLSVTPSPE